MIGTDAQMASNAHLYKHAGYDPVKDFVPVAYVGANIICLAVNSAAADQVRRRRDRLREEKSRQARLWLVRHRLAASSRRPVAPPEVRHRHPARALSGRRRGGERSARRPHRHGVPQPVAAVPHINTGKIRIVAMVEKARYAAMPDIPTIGETVPGFEMSSGSAFSRRPERRPTSSRSSTKASPRCSPPRALR